MAFPSSLPLYLDDPPTSWNQQQQQQHNQVLHLQQQQQQPPPPPLVHDHHDGLSSASASASASTRPNSMAERARLAKIPQPEQALKCPRCESTNTKFCYFNNYSLSQPRHFCKACRRYWTRGGSLRSVPVGGGCRRNNKRNHSKSKPSSTSAAASAGPTSLPALPSTTLPNIGLGFPGVQDMGVEQWRLNQFQQMYDFNELVKMEDNNLRGQFWGGEGSSSGGGGGGGGGGGWMFNSSGFNSSSTGSLL